MDQQRRIVRITMRAKGHPIPREYRILCFDNTGAIAASKNFPAEDDAAAAAIAKAMDGGVARELWEGDRLIARLAGTVV